MSHLLFRLRHVTEDEAEEVRQLLQQNDIEFYETASGFFGTGVAAFWLASDERLDFARSLIQQYQHERSERVRAQHLAECDAGEQDTFFKRLKREPVKLIAGIIVVGLILYISLMPFLTL